MMEQILSLVFLAQVLRITVPYALAALGGVISERSGVIALGLEGMLLVGAFGATVGSDAAGPVLGIAAGLTAGALWGVLLAAGVVWLRGDQVVVGIALNLLALGVTRFLLKLVYGSASSSSIVPGLPGEAGTWSFVIAALLIAWALHVALYRSAFGLRLRASGERPAAAASLGITVARLRWSAVVVSGALAGLGGAWLALAGEGFVDNMTSGRGYIALAAVIFGGWRPAWVAAACLLFGFADALQLNLQAHATFVPRELVQILPYAITLVALCSARAASRPPAALGQPL